jgi:outer membrane protein assembly factor BamB
VSQHVPERLAQTVIRLRPAFGKFFLSRKHTTESIGSGSTAYADGHLYLHGENGNVALVEATPEGYREKGRFTPPAQPTRKRQGPFPEKAWTYPVIANGRLYIRDIGTLWAYDIKAGR